MGTDGGTRYRVADRKVSSVQNRELLSDFRMVFRPGSVLGSVLPASLEQWGALTLVECNGSGVQSAVCAWCQQWLPVQCPVPSTVTLPHTTPHGPTPPLTPVSSLSLPSTLSPVLSPELNQSPAPRQPAFHIQPSPLWQTWHV